MTPPKREVPIRTFCEGRRKIIVSVETIIRFSHDINTYYLFKTSAEAMAVSHFMQGKVIHFIAV
jgi:hypothetical protein